MTIITDAMVERAATIDYTNYRGERAIRHVLPISFHFEANKYHEGVQWLMLATDLTKNKDRMFAMSSIHSWKPLDRAALEAARAQPLTPPAGTQK